MSSAVVAPLSSVKKQEYEQKIEALRKQQEDAFAKRVQENAQYAKITTEKLLLNFKEFKAAEAKKLANTESFYVPAEPKFVVAVQIRSQKKIGPTPRKILELLRLKGINRCVILRNNKSTRHMLQKAKDYIAYGFIDYELLRKLIYVRGFGKIGNSKVRLSNENIEAVFEGRYRCIEELAHAIYTGCDNIKQVLNFLYPFSLSAPLGGFRGNKAHNYLQGGCTNNHKELLGNLLERMI